MYKLLILSDWYLPGYKAGGPITSIYNLTSLLRNDFDISIITSDRDFGDSNQYENIRSDVWTMMEEAKVFYVPKSKNIFPNLFSLLKKKQYDVIYLNSMWSIKFTILPLIYLWRRGQSKIVLAPRGMLKDSAMKFKSTKKAVFLFFLKRFGLLKSVIFHATDEQERIDIKRIFPKNEVSLVSNIPATAIDKIERQKSIGACKLVFTGRIHPIKGLDVLLEALRNRTEQITLEVIGPAEDKAYEKKCKSIIATFNSNIVVTFKGSLPFHEILKIYKNSHVFILPTMGENFGHAIYEALLSGLPVIISDQTPWRDLREKIVGFDLPLSEKDGFSKAIEFFINMNNEVYNEWSDSARAYANTQIDKKEIKNKYIELFS